MRYAWFVLACVAVAIVGFHLTFKIERQCVANTKGQSSGGYGGRLFVPTCIRHDRVLVLR